ncbi:hypothetical protein ACQPU1_06535 [Clostridium paraputrificum]|uniref:hypothetical protein n=1 Tax=Clostridium TaxID=1485 RepID=UPI003D325A1A
MGLFDEMKRAATTGRIMAEVKQAEKYKEIKEKDDKEKAANYTKQGIAFCPRCCATNIKTTKKKYSIGRGEKGPLLMDTKGKILGSLVCRDITLVCPCCGYKWKPTK